MNAIERRDVVVVNGFNKFHLAPAAAVLDASGHLQAFLTGAYPFRRLQAGLTFLGLTHARLKKFYDRAEKIDPQRVSAHFFAETVYFSRYFLLRWPALRRIADWLDRSSFRLFAWQAAGTLRAVGGKARIFHYRSGFGLTGARTARERGMILLCDHSIVHPRWLEALVRNGGRFPPAGSAAKISPIWRPVLEDISLADVVVVNSDFVRDSFLRAGYPAERIEVVYLGLDEAFFRAIPLRGTPAGSYPGAVRMLYAGMFERRKGAEVLLDALENGLDGSWRLEIVGKIAPELQARAERLLARPNVTWRRVVRRGELARLMSEADLFVFPSLAEGSARVIFEAMACGCAILTTPNAGSIVREDEHGWLVAPGEAEELRVALNRILRRGAALGEVGERNARLVRESYRESDYGDKLRAVYSRALGRGTARPALAI